MDASSQTPGLLDQRGREVDQVADRAAAWAAKDPRVRGACMVGSWARGAGTLDSDVDIILLVTEPLVFAETDAWLKGLGAPPVVRRKQWGVVTERRVRLPSGLEVEYGIAPLSWAATDPLDSGTGRIVREGFSILFDPDGRLTRLQASVTNEPAADASFREISEASAFREIVRDDIDELATAIADAFVGYRVFAPPGWQPPPASEQASVLQRWIADPDF